MNNWLRFGLSLLGFTIGVNAQNIWVANGGSATIATLNVGTGAISQSPFLGGAIGGVAISPDGSTMYASLTYGNTVAAMSTSSNTVLASLAVGTTPGHLAISPNGAWVYVINQG